MTYDCRGSVVTRLRKVRVSLHQDLSKSRATTYFDAAVEMM